MDIVLCQTPLDVAYATRTLPLDQFCAADSAGQLFAGPFCIDILLHSASAFALCFRSARRKHLARQIRVCKLVFVQIERLGIA